MMMETHKSISESFEDWLRRSLIEAGELLRPEVAKQILEQGAAAVGPLIRILEDRALHEDPEGALAPIHAAGLLGDLRAHEAIPALLAALADDDHRDCFADEVVPSLIAMRSAALEPVLQAYAGSSDPYHRQDLASILCSLGVRDERIFTILLEALERMPDTGAAFLSLYGDARALAPLHRTFDEFSLDSDLCPACVVMGGEIRAAIQRLGGSLSAEQERWYLRLSEGASADVWPQSGRDGAAAQAKRKRREARKQQKASRKRNRR